jgi:hypothetical protein
MSDVILTLGKLDGKKVKVTMRFTMKRMHGKNWQIALSS